MPIIPFAMQQESGMSEYAEAHPISENCIVDEKGALFVRPGIAAATGLISSVVDSNGIAGLHATSDGRVYAIGEGSPSRHVYRVKSTAEQLTSTGYKLRGEGRPVMAETEAMVVIAAGKEMQRILLTDDSFALLSPSAPRATHVAANASRLLSNDQANKGYLQFSGQAAGSSTSGHETWQDQLTSGFVSAEARPDNVQAVGENTNEVFVWGTTTVQVFAPDAVVFYATAATREFGLGAPYAYTKRDQGFAWLDHRRRIVFSDGRSFEVMSDPIQKDLDDIVTISDCWAFWFKEGVADCLVFVFPTDGRTFVYQSKKGWGQWSGWSKSGPVPFTASAHTVVAGDNTNLVGTTSGLIGELSMNNTTDFGEVINVRSRTGFISRDTHAMKQCNHVWLTLSRGNTPSPTEPIVVWLKWRDSPDESWNEIPVDLGDSSDREPVVRLDALGTYRRRQWELVATDAQFEMASIEEDFEVTGA